MSHLRFSGQPDIVQRAALEAIVRADPVLMAVLEGLREIGLPDWLVVSGAIYNRVWNELTGRPPLNGINDIDMFYFDDTDLSYAAEDKVIRALAERFAGLPRPVQARNQARVHEWYPAKFGLPFTPLKSSAEMLTRFATKTHAVGVRLTVDSRLGIEAPYGLDHLFSFRIVPNRVLDNRPVHEAKGVRALSVWPELTLIPWDEGDLTRVR